MSLLEHALNYAERLGPVFPRPVTGIGLDQATTDPAALTAMWRPWANIALACDRAGVLVLDVDAKHGVDGFASLAALEAAHGPLPASWRASTPSGGAHLYFRHPPRHIGNRTGFKAGLDIKATRGSIILPPSRKPNGPYTWEREPWACPLADPPDWLLQIITPPAPPERSFQPIRAASQDRMARYVESAVNGECSAVATFQRGGRNLRLFQAAANLGELVGAGLLPSDLAADALEQAAEECGLVREDGRRAVFATIASGLKRGVANPRRIAA